MIRVVQSLPLLTEFSNDLVQHFSIDASKGGSFGETISPNELEATPSSKFRKRKISILDEIFYVISTVSCIKSHIYL